MFRREVVRVVCGDPWLESFRIGEKKGVTQEKFAPGDDMGPIYFSPFIAPALEEIAKAHPEVIEDLGWRAKSGCHCEELNQLQDR